MSDVLDQQDIDALLEAVNAGDVEHPAEDMQIFSRFRRDLERVEMREYDFTRPERISPDQIRALRALHESFARNFGTSLSAFLRSIVEVGVCDVEQMTYSEFIVGLPNPTSFNLISASGLDSRICLEISPLIIYPLLDRLLGGSSQDLFIPQRPMTLIETRLIRKVLDRAMASLGEAWRGLGDIDFTVAEMESNPHLIQIVSPNDLVVVIRFELKSGKRAGTMSLCLPFNAIEPLLEEGDATRRFSSGRGRAPDALKEQIGQCLNRVGVDVSACLPRTTMTLQELQSLEVGDLIVTSASADHPLVVSVEGVPKFLAEIGRHGSNRAVQIIRAIGPNDR